MNEDGSPTERFGAEGMRPAVYLCQVNQAVSCGACCGLYNIPNLSRDALTERLIERTKRFAATPRTENAIERFRRQIEGWTPEDRPLPQFHHCPFLGLVGARRSRVGCLLHPRTPGNQGHDWRHLSYYGAKACRTYFCPSGRLLPERYLQIMLGIVDHWYPYGLVITEHRLLRALFGILEQRLGRLLQPDEAWRAPIRKRLRTLFDILLAWPYRPVGGPGWCPFPFDNGLYERPPVVWPSAARPAAPYPLVFRELTSVFPKESDQQAAVSLLDSCLNRLVDDLCALAATGSGTPPERSTSHP